MPDVTPEILWMPACPRCGREHRGLVFLPGTGSGPADTSHIYAHWRCEACGRLNYLPQSQWVSAGILHVPGPEGAAAIK
ncbi:MAG TPA: hypothetical protein VI997_05065 [Candidatus Thermoplasmatota archaeon]|nr:hypothetical protein [Candidatus Thermoplasmatota archaeon]